MAHEWGWAWPANRRVPYSRASADPDGKPWSERKRYVWWDGETWTGYDVPDVQPRSPMSMGAWALTLFATWPARALGAANAVVGGYLGSYTGVLLASTAVPVWARSRLFVGPIFVSTAAATGAAACRLTLGLPADHPTARALSRVQTGAMAAELGLSVINERRLGPLAAGLKVGRPGKLFKAAKWAVRGGLALQGARRQRSALLLYLADGLLFRYAWVGAGPLSARDDRMVAEMARSERHRH